MSELWAAPVATIAPAVSVKPPAETVHADRSGRVSEKTVAELPWVSKPGFAIRFVAASAAGVISAVADANAHAATTRHPPLRVIPTPFAAGGRFSFRKTARKRARAPGIPGARGPGGRCGSAGRSGRLSLRRVGRVRQGVAEGVGRHGVGPLQGQRVDQVDR